MYSSLKHNKFNGFTIIELMIVVIVIGILVSISIISYNGLQQSGRDKSILSDIDAVAAEINRYAASNNSVFGTAVAWYSGGTANANINFMPTAGNVIDVVANSGSYCIRGYNPSANKNSITNSYTQESTAGSCTILPASVAAGGSGDSALVGWWKLNGDVTDSSGNNQNGSNNGGVTPTANGNLVANQAFAFNGSGYLNVPLSGLPTTMSNATINFWARPRTPYASASVLASVPNDGTNWLNVHLPFSDGNWYADVGNLSGGGRISGVFNGAWVNVWAMWSFTSQPGVGMKAYRNGTLIGSTGATSIFTKGASSLDIGRLGTTYWNGDLDDLRIYSKALSLTEIQTLNIAGPQ
jgi:prepilin-type N-terminal cleavage/methylation domain-containing protein